MTTILSTTLLTGNEIGLSNSPYAVTRSFKGDSGPSVGLGEKDSRRPYGAASCYEPGSQGVALRAPAWAIFDPSLWDDVSGVRSLLGREMRGTWEHPFPWLNTIPGSGPAAHPRFVTELLPVAIKLPWVESSG